MRSSRGHSAGHTHVPIHPMSGAVGPGDPSRPENCYNQCLRLFTTPSFDPSEVPVMRKTFLIMGGLLLRRWHGIGDCRCQPICQRFGAGKQRIGVVH